MPEKQVVDRPTDRPPQTGFYLIRQRKLSLPPKDTVDGRWQVPGAIRSKTDTKKHDYLSSLIKIGRYQVTREHFFVCPQHLWFVYRQNQQKLNQEVQHQSENPRELERKKLIKEPEHQMTNHYHQIQEDQKRRKEHKRDDNNKMDKNLLI